jgi:hypothetical protein
MGQPCREREATIEGDRMRSHVGRWTTGRKARAVIGLLLVFGFCVQCRKLSAEKAAPNQANQIQRPKVNPSAAYATVKPPAPLVDPLGTLIKTDPVAFFRGAIERYERSVHDYVCTFSKQELIGGHLTAEQVTQVKFREKPFSVNMFWVRNADKAQRAIYVAGKWTGKDGEKLAVVEPAGAIARLFVDDVMRPIDGPDAKKAGRRQIDQFGFENSMQLILKYCDIAAQHHELDLKYVGEGTIGGRPTFVLERRLPYTDDNGTYPDRILVVHIDQEYMMPTCCISYADEAKTRLLGKYVTTDIKFNVGLTDRDFARKGEQ